MAKALDGTFLVRMEDIDTPRIVVGAEERILGDLAWLGLQADEGCQLAPTAGASCVLTTAYRQSRRGTLYEAALAELSRVGRTYPCDCSRTDISRVASAPHPGEEQVYPGTCRDKDPERRMKREPSLRFRIRPEDTVEVTDVVQGRLDPSVLRGTGDFVLQRGDKIVSYQLAAAVDDLAMRITHVVRGVDLLASTPKQLLLMQALSNGRLAWAPEGGELPSYAHLPLVLGPDGARLAKRTAGASVHALRERGVHPHTILGQLAHGLGLVSRPDRVAASDLAGRLRGQPIVFKNESWRLP